MMWPPCNVFDNLFSLLFCLGWIISPAAPLAPIWIGCATIDPIINRGKRYHYIWILYVPTKQIVLLSDSITPDHGFKLFEDGTESMLSWCLRHWAKCLAKYRKWHLTVNYVLCRVYIHYIPGNILRNMYTLSYSILTITLSGRYYHFSFLDHMLAGFSCEGPDDKYFRLHGPWDVCWDTPLLL